MFCFIGEEYWKRKKKNKGIKRKLRGEERWRQKHGEQDAADQAADDDEA